MRQNWHIPFFIIKNISPMNLSLSPAGSAANPAAVHLYIGGRQLTIADRRPLILLTERRFHHLCFQLTPTHVNINLRIYFTVFRFYIAHTYTYLTDRRHSA